MKGLANTCFWRPCPQVASQSGGLYLKPSEHEHAGRPDVLTFVRIGAPAKKLGIISTASRAAVFASAQMEALDMESGEMVITSNSRVSIGGLQLPYNGNVISIFRGKPGALSGHEALRARHRFSKVAGKGVAEITPEQFKALVGSSGQPCADALFNYVDFDHSGSRTYKEISHEIKTYRSMTTAEAKLRVLFSFYDQDHDGKISLVELAAAMKVACQALSESQLNQLATATMEEFDVDKNGFLNFVEFSALIEKSGLELNA